MGLEDELREELENKPPHEEDGRDTEKKPELNRLGRIVVSVPGPCGVSDIWVGCSVTVVVPFVFSFVRITQSIAENGLTKRGCRVAWGVKVTRSPPCAP